MKDTENKFPAYEYNPNPQPYQNPLASSPNLFFPPPNPSMPSSPPPPIHDDIYTQLITALHPPPPQVPEIEILPSSFPPKIHHDPPGLGVPKSLLVPLFLKARTSFFAHVLSSQQHGYNGESSYDAALAATSVILLFDPNHLTAANFRKRHLERFFFSRGKRSEDNNNHDGEENKDGVGNVNGAALVVRNELRFLESLLTSPLGKHAKSSTLWAQRLWIARDHLARLAMREYVANEEEEEEKKAIETRDVRRGMKGFWEAELAIVRKAGERHGRNYYAWQYARQIFDLVCSAGSEPVERRHLVQGLLRDSIGPVRRWCLMHPRDISGWTFLFSLVERLRDEGCNGEVQGEVGDEIGRSVWETREFTGKFEWKGESVDWFLKAINTLNNDD